MGTQKPFSLHHLKNNFNFEVNGVLRGFLYREMIRIGNFLWVSACNFLLFLFGFVDRYLHRLEADENFGKYDSCCVIEKSKEKDDILKSDWPRKKEKVESISGSVLEKMETDKKTEKTSFGDNYFLVPSASKYEISFIKDLSGFVEEPKTMSFTVEEMFSEWKDDFISENRNKENHDKLSYSENGFGENYPEKGKVFMVGNDQSINQISHNDEIGILNLETEEKTEDSVHVYSEESDFGNLEKVNPNESGFPEDTEIEFDSGLGQFRLSPSYSELECSDYTEKEKTEDSVQVLTEKNVLESEENLVSHDNIYLGIKEIEKSEFSGEFSFSLMNYYPIKEESIMSQKLHPNSSYYEENNFPISEKSINVEKPILDYSNIFDEENDDEFIEIDPNSQILTNKEEKEGNIFEDEDDGEFDILLQHQQNVEKMKMEMKNSKAKGLPTILENCESFKIGEDLKPLKFDEKKLDYKDRVDEIQKVYKIYSEKMRKLDILNYQTLNAISFMQLKDPNLVKRSSSLAMKSIFPSKLRRVHADPTLKSIFEMHKKLETVYIGQICLTWETLRWEYEKTKELLEYDSNVIRSYNLIAGEFQQFQVLVQRFVEDEQFLGPRVQNYAKNRCELRVFLQVPVIKEDCLKEKRENRIEGNYQISISMLLDIIDETMRVFWEFLSADHKDDKFSVLKGLSPSRLDLLDPSDSELLMEIKTNLHMMDKRLKDILRNRNCVVKKFQKQREGRTNSDLLFAQIDMRLVSRVLNMSRLTTDQLIWCQNKLHKVKFSHRKVHVEPSFLLFPF